MQCINKLYLSPWGESWKRTRVARTAALTRYRYVTDMFLGKLGKSKSKNKKILFTVGTFAWNISLIF